MAPVKRERYYVTVDRPDGVSVTEMTALIRERLTPRFETPMRDYDLKPTIRREPVDTAETRRLQSIADRPRKWGSVVIEPEPLRGTFADVLTSCKADRDGDCYHAACPQIRDGEPAKSRRHCPLDTCHDED